VTAVNVDALDSETRTLVRLAAAVAAGDDAAVRAAVELAAGGVPPVWVEEVLLQSYLFCGFPRALNAMREWRRASGRSAPPDDGSGGAGTPDEWRARGEATCAVVYGGFYPGLRRNVRALHPALDEWMVVDGYGKILSRPGLDLVRRELCVVAACAATRQERQLHSHLHGALNAGASRDAVSATLAAARDYVSAHEARSHDLLWQRVQGK
jgi:4-carboxymuconolactone decarboxylase